MKFILIFIFVIFNYVNANEMQRIESIVGDISELRAKYAASQQELSVQIKKNKSLNKEISLYSDFTKKEIDSLKLKLKTEKLQTKNLKTPECIPEKIIVTKVVTQDIIEDNKFPQLQMKSDEKIEVFEASSFRLNNDALIYDEIGGNEIDKWVAKTSFTSTQKTKQWMKITGYFVKKVWTKAPIDMWIERADILKRYKK